MDTLIPSNIQPSPANKKYAILIASVMFLWSGTNKILNFDKKVSTLMKKTKLGHLKCQSLINISEPTRPPLISGMPTSD